MFEHLRKLLADPGARGPAGAPADERRLAAAVLLLEVARADYDHHPAERDALRGALAREFQVPEDTLDALLEAAELKAKESVSLFEFVQTLNRAMSAEEKRALVELLWDVAHSDGRVDPHEEHLLRRIADLLHVPHADFIRGKLAAAHRKSQDP